MPLLKIKWNYGKYERWFLVFARAVTVGFSYVVASSVTGLRSSFVTIFTALLSFDIFVAFERFPRRKSDWQQFFQALKPRILSTAITLGKGSLTGTVLGLAVLFGVPHIVGAVLTSGLSYVWAINTRHAISTFVSVLAGLALFERLTNLEQVQPWPILKESASVITLSAVGTFSGLVIGWVLGLVLGGITRALLSKPYRSLKSAAYDLPLEMQPFNRVMQIGDRSVVVPVMVESGAPVANRPLSESGLRENCGATVLAIKRGQEEYELPRGGALLREGDEVTVLVDKQHLAVMHEQFKTAQRATPPSESVVAPSVDG